MGIGHPYDQGYGISPHVPVTILTTDQVERLAKAGVIVELAHKVEVQDPPPEPPNPYNMFDQLTAMIWDRWRRSNMARAYEGELITLKAVEHGDKVYVFAYAGKASPEIIEDEAAIYPSDALFARIHLMMQHAK